MSNFTMNPLTNEFDNESTILATYLHGIYTNSEAKVDFDNRKHDQGKCQ